MHSLKYQPNTIPFNIITSYKEFKYFIKRTIFNIMHYRECILENAFSRMHFAENSVFGKILKLFIRSDYAERNCVWLVF